jgi:hypothetical protein
VISRSADRAPPPYSAHQTRGQVSHSGQRVRVQVPPPTPYSLHSQVAPDSARQVRAQAGQPSLLVSELRGNEAAPRARYRARGMLPQVRPAAAAAAEALTAGGGEERYQPRGATNKKRIPMEGYLEQGLCCHNSWRIGQHDGLQVGLYRAAVEVWTFNRKVP